MSNYYRIQCLACEEGMEDGVNHGDELLIHLIKHPEAAVAIGSAGDISYATEPVDIGVLVEHDKPGCQLVVMSEYDDHYFDAEGKRHEVADPEGTD